MANKQKVLICGDVNGNFKTLFKRVESINEKNGPFDFLLCIGNFFGSSDNGWQEYKAGKRSVPVPTYILGPNTERHINYYLGDGDELAPNVHYLGKKGVFNASSGLKICYVSGLESKSSGDCFFTTTDITRVRDTCIRGQPSFRGVDILLTSDWPSGVTRLDPRAIDNPPAGSPLLSWLAVQVKPRYHFCGLRNRYYERPPYKNLDTGCDSGAHCTRFMALAALGNAEKHRWLYALSLTPIDSMPVSELRQQTTDQTDLPYTGQALSHSCTIVPETSQPSQFFYDMSASKRHHEDERVPFKRIKHTQQHRAPALDQDQCWFCLASPKVEKHLVISVGDEVYLALAKGGLSEHHCLIIPVQHHSSTTTVPETVASEIELYKKSLTRYFAEHNHVPVFYERNYKAPHLQIQVVPVPMTVVDNVKTTFEDFADAEGFPLDELPEFSRLEQIAPPGTPYFYVEVPSGDKLYHRITKKSFPLNFGREVLACPYILDMMPKSDWKKCVLSKEEETENCERFKEEFKTYDFALEYFG